MSNPNESEAPEPLQPSAARTIGALCSANAELGVLVVELMSRARDAQHDELGDVEPLLEAVALLEKELPEDLVDPPTPDEWVRLRSAISVVLGAAHKVEDGEG